MKYKFEAFKIEEKVLATNTNEISNMYMIKMDYETLVNICGIGNVSINRQVDPTRARKMVKYIKDKESFYPPLIVATTKKNAVVYDDIKKIINIDSEKLSTNHDLLVIDGQHRYTSIKYLIEEDKSCALNRYQSVFFIDNLNEFQQRKIFVDINNNAKKVTTGTKLRLEKTLINYISLSVVDNNIKIQEKIVMDENQTGDLNDIPYKFIIRGNEKLLDRIDKDYDKDILDLNDVDKFLKLVHTVWVNIFNIIEVAQINDYQIVSNEAFYIAFCDYMRNTFDSAVYNIDNSIIEDIDFDKFSEDVSKIKEDVVKKLNYINDIYYKSKLTRTKERCNKIFDLITEVINESGEKDA